MSDNAELIVRLRSPSGIGEPLDHAAMCEAADALERAEREHEERLDALERKSLLCATMLNVRARSARNRRERGRDAGGAGFLSCR